MSDKYVDVYGKDVPVFSYKPRHGLFLDSPMRQKAAMFRSINQNWTTPLDLYNRIKQERGLDNYDTDPATSESNPLGCNLYYTEKENGLEQKWIGAVFINPPFGRAHYKGVFVYLPALWIEEAHKRTQTEKNPEVSMVTMLLPARTDTKAFHEFIYDVEKCRPRENVRIQFLKGRLKFGDSKISAPFPSMIVDFMNPTFLHKGFIQQGGE